MGTSLLPTPRLEPHEDPGPHLPDPLAGVGRRRRPTRRRPRLSREAIARWLRPR